ncbi:MAG: DUF6994 family protein [bacterium]
MGTCSRIDIAFDFRSDTPGYPKNDPDSSSPTLRQYHKWLWSKPLPSGAMFALVDTKPGVYLHHRSPLGEFWLTSDTVVPSFRKQARLAHIFARSPEELAAFNRLGYTIGGMMVFPGNRVGRRMTINGARGCHPRIKDRFDLTVECIRRHYRNEESPLTAPLQRYADFLGLFGDFRGYVEFFLLQDLVTEDCSAVTLFAPFDDFASSPVPATEGAYQTYRRLAMDFIRARNRRIQQSC